MAVAKDKGSIVKYGGGILKAVEVNDLGERTVDPAPDVHDLGYILDTELSYDTEIEDIPDESGSVVASLPGAETVKLTGLFLQTDSVLLDFLRDSTGDKFYRIYYKMTRTNELNTKTQELFGGICKIKPMFRVKAGDKKVPFEITMLNNDSAIALIIADPEGAAIDDTPSTIFGAVATTATIAANSYYEITEN